MPCAASNFGRRRGTGRRAPCPLLARLAPVSAAPAARALPRAPARGIGVARRRLAAAAARLQALSPVAVLARGYAVCRDAATGRVLTRSAATAPGRRVEVRLHRGALDCEVKEVRS